MARNVMSFIPTVIHSTCIFNMPHFKAMVKQVTVAISYMIQDYVTKLYKTRS